MITCTSWAFKSWGPSHHCEQIEFVAHSSKEGFVKFGSHSFQDAILPHLLLAGEYLDIVSEELRLASWSHHSVFLIGIHR